MAASALGRGLEGRQGGRDGRRDGRVGLGHAVAVAGQAERKIVVLEADAQRRFRRVLVPKRRSQVISLMRLLPPPVVSWARIASMALWRLVSAAVRSEEVVKGPAPCSAKMSESWPSSLVSLRPRAASKTAWVTWPRSAVAIFWSTLAGVVLRLTAAVKSVVLGRSRSAVAIF